MADRGPASVGVDLGSPAGAHRFGDFEEHTADNSTRLAGARLGRRCTRDLLQVARDQYRAGPRDDAGAVGAWSRISTAQAFGSRGTAPAPRRALDRRQEALSGRLQQSGAWYRRQACLE